MAEPVRVISRRFDVPNCTSIDVYLKHDGYVALEKALKQMQPDEVTTEVKKSALRGRGGAGFPTGMKWSFVPKDSPKPKYVVCNADESEPGTFKDRAVMELDPHSLIEGCLIAAYALGAHTAYIYIRGEYGWIQDLMDVAIAEAYAKGFCGKNIMGTDFACDVYTHPGGGAYICGEETALLNSLEGKRGHPRIKPPFPAIEGLYKCPTVVNNVETLATVPWIIQFGGDTFRELGTEKSGGTRLVSVCGHVNKPGVYEIPLGYPMKDLLEIECGGIRNGNKLKAVIPGGSSVPIITAEEAYGVMLDFESITEVGSMLGSGGVIVMDETADIFESTFRLVHFYKHESCGWCTPCRDGGDWMEQIFDRISIGGGRQEDLDLITLLGRNIEGKSHCALGDALVWPITSAMKKFPEDFQRALDRGKKLLREPVGA
ncbi:MAG TPA: NADH-quinone oxidoreductase subunit NuoF [Blastocatellia bacterium]|nr:NADH-quinone oxidoreductase subunit NuoF [Blastocatellia bacterium]